jgi:hypothetical protein
MATQAPPPSGPATGMQQQQQPSSRYALRPPPSGPLDPRRASSSIASSRSRASSNIQSSLPPPISESIYRGNNPEQPQPYIHRTVSATSSITSMSASEYDSCIYSASSAESTGTGNSQYFENHPPNPKQQGFPRRAYPPPRTPLTVNPHTFMSDVSPIAAVSPDSFQAPAEEPSFDNNDNNSPLAYGMRQSAQQPPQEQEDPYYFQSPSGTGPTVTPPSSPSDYYHPTQNPTYVEQERTDYYHQPTNPHPNRTPSQKIIVPQSFLDTPENFSTSGMSQLGLATGDNSRHEEDWRIHGRAFRAELIKQDEQNGRHQFEMSDDCSIKRYHLVAEKVRTRRQMVVSLALFFSTYLTNPCFLASVGAGTILGHSRRSSRESTRYLFGGNSTEQVLVVGTTHTQGFLFHRSRVVGASSAMRRTMVAFVSLLGGTGIDY